MKAVIIAEQMTDQNLYLAFGSLNWFTWSADRSLATASAAAPLELAKRKANKRPALGPEKRMSLSLGLDSGLSLSLSLDWSSFDA